MAWGLNMSILTGSKAGVLHFDGFEAGGTRKHMHFDGFDVAYPNGEILVLKFPKDFIPPSNPSNLSNLSN
jgi:hypothetical protein